MSVGLTEREQMPGGEAVGQFPNEQIAHWLVALTFPMARVEEHPMAWAYGRRVAWTPGDVPPDTELGGPWHRAMAARAAATLEATRKRVVSRTN